MLGREDMNSMKDLYARDPVKCLEVDEKMVGRRITDFIKKEVRGFGGVVVGGADLASARQAYYDGDQATDGDDTDDNRSSDDDVRC